MKTRIVIGLTCQNPVPLVGDLSASFRLFDRRVDCFPEGIQTIVNRIHKAL